MTKENKTEIVAVLDRSGSMQSIAGDAIGGYNAFIESQKALPGEARLTTVLFDDEYEIIHDNRNIKRAEPLTSDVYQPRGSTALLDALGKTIDDVGVRLANTPEEERPSKVIVLVITDGEENCSRHYTRQQIFDKISHQRGAYSWDFVFLAANQDAIQAGSSMGFAAQSSFNYASTSKGVQDAYHLMSSYTTTARTGQAQQNKQDLDAAVKAIADYINEPPPSDQVDAVEHLETGYTPEGIKAWDDEEDS